MKQERENGARTYKAVRLVMEANGKFVNLVNLFRPNRSLTTLVSPAKALSLIVIAELPPIKSIYVNDGPRPLNQPVPM